MMPAYPLHNSPYEDPVSAHVLLYQACNIARKLLTVAVILSYMACTLLLAHFD